jgi:hypothetical protein
MSKAYAAMRPHVPGACYVNYCDLDLPDWAMSYWGANLSRLRQIKSQYDPNNIFATPKAFSRSRARRVDEIEAWTQLSVRMRAERQPEGYLNRYQIPHGGLSLWQPARERMS